jgi:hypothetical protein
LSDSRNAAVNYLTSFSDLLSKDELLISIYKYEVEILNSGMKFLPSYNADSSAWNEKVLHQQTELLKEIMSLELKAFELIKEELLKILISQTK